MCTNLAFVPLVYFCYPETANLTLEEMDYLFTNKEKSAVKVSKELRAERKGKQRNASFVTGAAVADTEKGANERSIEHLEQSNAPVEKR